MNAITIAAKPQRIAMTVAMTQSGFSSCFRSAAPALSFATFPRACCGTDTPAGVAAFLRKRTACGESSSGGFTICLVDSGTRQPSAITEAVKAQKTPRAIAMTQSGFRNRFSSSFRCVATESFAAESNLVCWGTVTITGIAESLSTPARCLGSRSGEFISHLVTDNVTGHRRRA